jgi:hypothetical protein
MMGATIEEEHVPLSCGTESEPAVATGTPGFVTQAGIKQPATNRFGWHRDSVFVPGDLAELGIGSIQVCEFVLEELDDPAVDAIGYRVGRWTTSIAVADRIGSQKSALGFEAKDLAGSEFKRPSRLGNGEGIVVGQAVEDSAIHSFSLQTS